MIDAHSISQAVEAYGESAVLDLVAELGSGDETGALFVLEGSLRLQRITRFETSDERTFKRRG
jgi:hypothetical protein